MITLRIECCTCYYYKQPLEMFVDTLAELNLEVIKKRIEEFGWIVEISGDHIDTYCSTKCAA